MQLFRKRKKTRIGVTVFSSLFRFIFSELFRDHVPYDPKGKTAIVPMDGSHFAYVCMARTIIEKAIGGEIVHYEANVATRQRDGETIGDTVIDDLMEILADDPTVTRVIAITRNPIIQNKDGETFVYGLASLGVPVCVVSCYSITKEHSRSFAKIVMHEILHTLGMEHCANDDCVMIAKVRPTGLIDMSEKLCASCESKIREKMRDVE